MKKFKKYLNSSTAVILIAICIFVGSAWAIWDRQPKIVYQPADACKLLTKDIAMDFLGNDVLGVDTSGAQINGSIADSKCSFSDSNPDKAAMKVAAMAIRTGINDDGVKKIRADFATKKTLKGNTSIKNIGKEAFFDPKVGQLNVLREHDWAILSYGIGTDPQSNKPDDVLKIARKVLK